MMDDKKMNPQGEIRPNQENKRYRLLNSTKKYTKRYGLLSLKRIQRL